MNIPNEFLQKLQAIQNPQQFITQAFLSKMPNPMISNLIKEANNGNSKGVIEFARNFCNERGINFDEEFSKFMGKR